MPLRRRRRRRSGPASYGHPSNATEVNDSYVANVRWPLGLVQPVVVVVTRRRPCGNWFTIIYVRFFQNFEKYFEKQK